MDFLIGGLAAAGAGFFSNPLDVLKTRMQLQGELKGRGAHAVHYRNVFHAAAVVVKNDGVWGLQKGVAPAVLMHFIRNFIRLGTFQWAKEHGYVTDANGKTIFYRSFLISSTAGAAGAFFGSPLFLIKTQLQSASSETVAVGHQHKHKGTVEAIKQIYRTHGMFGLWRGVNATMLRAVAGSSAQLTAFAMSKDYFSTFEFLRTSPIANSFAASLVGGVFQVLCMTPFDLISTRLYNQPLDEKGKGLMYKNIPDCFWKVLKSEGITGFYKGVSANYLRLAPHGALTLVFWDMLKDLQVSYKTENSKK